MVSKTDSSVSLRGESSLDSATVQSSEVVLEDVRLQAQCSELTCTVKATLDRADALRRLRSRIDHMASRIAVALENARSKSAGGDPFSAIASIEEASKLRARQLGLWQLALVFDPAARLPGPSEREIAQARAEALAAAVIVATGDVPTSAEWLGFWGLVSARLMALGLPALRMGGERTGGEWGLGGRLEAVPSSMLDRIQFARASARLTLRREGRETLTIDADANGGGPTAAVALRSAVEGLAERVSDRIAALYER